MVKSESSEKKIIGNVLYRAELDEFYSQYPQLLETEKPVEMGAIVPRNTTNVVSGDVLRKVQSDTLREVKDFLSKTFGPMGSNTKIITGTNRENISSSYSKDGLKVLQNIVNSAPIEASIIEELIEITRHVEKEVGDGTTSTVILSSLIFDKLLAIQNKYNIPPYQLIQKFNNTVSNIKEIILENGKSCTIDDIYNIAMVSTNSDMDVAANIKNIYETYGMDVDLSVGISNTSDSMVKVYDGLTITEGMSDPVFINNKEKGICEIRNPQIYHFSDPVDTIEMVSLFEAIIKHNIYDQLENDEAPIPTVIICPKVSKDMSVMMRGLATTLYQFDTNNLESAKPPIVIVTNVIGSDEVIMDDISHLCGCKSIHKYLDPKILKKDQEEGKAPTVHNVHTFFGKAESVVSDTKKTKFINPVYMHSVNNGEIVPNPIYTALVNFLETEIETNKSTATAGELGLLKKRLAALKANMVDYLVGGITIADRDAKKDLIEDAIKNCKSASLYGVGNAANFEGLKASYNYLSKLLYEYKDKIDEDIARSIFVSYYDITKILYGTVCSNDIDISNAIAQSLESDCPFDISKGEIPDNPSKFIKCSIMLDINILDTLSKIITIMVTCNQCLLQAPQLNNY